MNNDTPRSIVGRTIVFVLFGTVVAYFAIAILGSIVGNLYGGPPPADSGVLSLRERTWCIRTIVGLRDELEGQVTLELQHPRWEGDPSARWLMWRDGWRGKLAGAEQRCVSAGNASLDRACMQLSELETNYATVVELMIRTRTGVSPALQESLSDLKRQR